MKRNDSEFILIVCFCLFAVAFFAVLSQANNWRDAILYSVFGLLIGSIILLGISTILYSLSKRVQRKDREWLVIDPVTLEVVRRVYTQEDADKWSNRNYAVIENEW